MKTYLEPEEINRVEDAATNLRDRLLIHILFHLGCRISEALAIKVSDISFDNNTVTIQHLKTRLRLSCPECKASLGRRHTYCPRCGTRVEKAVADAKEHRRLRTLPLNEDICRMLQD
jgi:integrase/recombinase XerD